MARAPSKATRSQPTAPRVPPEPAKPDSGDRGQNARCQSETALTYLEEDIISAENELAKLDKEIANQPNLQAEFDQVLQYAKYILEHLPELLLDLCNPLRKAAFFAAIFNKVPTYDEIKFGTHKNSSLPEVNELFRIRMDDKSFDGDLTGNRTPVAGMRTQCPNR